jgi:hypothetical protein
MRHTYASLQLAASANIKYLSQQMGHASVQITLDRYSHLLQDSHPAQAARLSGLVFDTPSTEHQVVATAVAAGAIETKGSLENQMENQGVNRGISAATILQPEQPGTPPKMVEERITPLLKCGV